MFFLHGLTYSILIALANNVDNIGVRIAYSVKGIKLDVFRNLWISVITFVISAIAAALGEKVSGTVGNRLCSTLSFLLLLLIGLWFIFEPYLKRKIPEPNKKKSEEKQSLLGVLADPEKSDIDHSKNIDFKEATLLGVSLSINNVGGSLSGGMIGLNPLLIGALSAIISFIALWAGNYLTRVFVRMNLGRKASVIAGIILILIGIKQIL